eukprot:Clim_evm16s11 gene=Clim_evmTU16s11
MCEDSGTPGVIYLFTKYPYLGKCKTRLAKAGLQEEIVQKIARAFLLDILHKFSEQRIPEGCDWVRKAKRIVLYAPADAREGFEVLLREEGIASQWSLAPQTGGLVSDLGSKLTDCLKAHVSRFGTGTAAIFIGMDSPHLDPRVVNTAIRSCQRDNVAYIQPATDGGYVMLAIPGSTGVTCFQNIRWSSEATCEDQTGSIKESGTDCRVHNEALRDVDDLDDLMALKRWLEENGSQVAPRSHLAVSLIKL